MKNLTAGLALGLVALGAHAEIVEIRWDAQAKSEASFQVAPGKFAEACGKLTKGQKVSWSFESDRPLNFNIHYHVGKKVEYPAKQADVAQLQGELAVALDQDYCWMWSNKGNAPAALKLLLQRSE
ncbi:hypothetical protein HNQ51_002166 [Inhella inkyongensis]|uniref:Uncharacterized protein n=1 Tax=Inhella inkyongensis TaxID=392593 RepID=A0A840S5J9_9BURK|nr:hypothetical protein [Inhella inkyongensis]MBB5204852.1 hypothetical protein [Inhella inkyongensis]